MSDERVVHCVGSSGSPCGRYVSESRALRPAWHAEVDHINPYAATVWTCRACFESRVRSKLRAAIVNGGKPASKWSAEERELAEQMVGHELAAVSDRHETPVMGTPAAPQKDYTVNVVDLWNEAIERIARGAFLTTATTIIEVDRLSILEAT